jgi:hypothetical protein
MAAIDRGIQLAVADGAGARADRRAGDVDAGRRLCGCGSEVDPRGVGDLVDEVAVISGGGLLRRRC